MSKTNNKHKRIIGIDLHPSCFAAAALTMNKRKLWVHGRVELYNMDNWFKNHIQAGDTLILESGCNSVAFAKKASLYNIECIILDSVKVGQISKAYCKTDKEDAVKIAKIYLSGLAQKQWIPDNATILRRQVLSKYNQTNKAVVKAKNMIKSFLVENGIQFPKGKKIFSKQGKNLVLKSDLSITQIMLLKLLYRDLEHAQGTKKELAKLMAQDILHDKNAIGLIKLCGIRTICAFALIAAAGDIKRFSSPKKFAAYLGLVPTVKQSGDNKKHGRVGYGGRNDTKPFLIQGAQAVLRASDEYGAGFKSWGHKIAKKKGRNIAVTALARKMAIAAWYQLNGYKTNIHIPTATLEYKVRRMALELGGDVLEEIGYENPTDFRKKMKESLLEVA